MGHLKTFIILIICMLSIICCSSFFTCSKKSEWIILFDGGSTDAWRGFHREDFPPQGWLIENGALKTIVGGDRCDIITKDIYKDFELELECKVSPGGNSGIFYRATEEYDDVWQSAPEMQVLDDDFHQDGLDPKTSAGSLYALIAPTNKVLLPVGEFNKVHLIVNKNHVEHWLNDVKILAFELDSDSLKNLIAESKFKDYPNFGKAREGHIALQHHGDEVWYRNVRIRSLY